MIEKLQELLAELDGLDPISLELAGYGGIYWYFCPLLETDIRYTYRSSRIISKEQFYEALRQNQYSQVSVLAWFNEQPDITSKYCTLNDKRQGYWLVELYARG